MFLYVPFMAKRSTRHGVQSTHPGLKSVRPGQLSDSQELITPHVQSYAPARPVTRHRVHAERYEILTPRSRARSGRRSGSAFLPSVQSRDRDGRRG